jgi:hypothetical protein
MPRLAFRMSTAVLAAMLIYGLAHPAAAEQDGTREQDATREYAAQSRPHIVIHPRHRYLPPSAKRHCVSWLAKEDRPSGPVITPQMRCWWQW